MSDELQQELAISKNLMPKPFEWCYIPQGKGILIPFYLSKYPITNAQFAKFIATGAYENEQWWTQEAWEYQQEYQIRTPRYWYHNLWNQDDYPVVGVSWYEAQAFCQWFSYLTNQMISLPSGLQWKRAAQGDDGRSFPWGNHHRKTPKANMPRYQKSRNRYEKGFGRTSPVTAYPTGESPYGVWDMLGNVWEWTKTDYWYGNRIVEDYVKPRSKILRGGSWFSEAYIGNINRYHPNTRNQFCGFRICLNI